MSRTALLATVFALVVGGCGAWRSRATAAAPAPRAGVAAPAPPIPPTTRKIDEYGNIAWNDERARLDNFAIELQSDPAARGYLMCYGGRVGRPGEAGRRCRRAKNYVSRHRGIAASRVVTIDGGFRENLTVELWVVPPGATLPHPSPSLDPREVWFVKRKYTRRPRGR
jgi:hypothetical protein